MFVISLVSPPRKTSKRWMISPSRSRGRFADAVEEDLREDLNNIRSYKANLKGEEKVHLLDADHA